MKAALTLILCLYCCLLRAQAPDASYVKALYQKYPTQKSDLCAACKLWVNPYYKSIADTLKHAPLLTYYVYTAAHRIEQESLNLPRTGAYAAWHPAYGQPDETKVYKQANQESTDMIAKGHCQAWILLAWSADAAILSNTYTFNAALEYQGQNIGTELATEELCRRLTGHKTVAVTDSVKIWCGTSGNVTTYTSGKISSTMPACYYKVIRYRDTGIGGDVVLCYWMPNDPKEKRTKLPERIIAYNDLVKKLGFDPQATLK